MIKSVVALAGALTLTFLTQPVLGQSKEAMEVCEEYSESARLIMGARQDGVEIAKVMRLAEKADDAAIKDIVVRAYSEPRYNTERNKQNSVTDFSNEVYLACITALKAKESQ